MRSRPVLVVAVLLGVICRGLAAQSAVGLASPSLGPGDAVRLEFIAEERGGTGPASGEYRVDDEGVVLLPVAGRVVVAGRPFSDVRREVERAFAAEFTDASVRLTPLVRVAVLGEVRTPGLVLADPTMALADVLAAAGGLTDSADRGSVRLVRPGEREVVHDQETLAAAPVPLRSGDRVVVGQRSWLSQNAPFLIGSATSLVAAVLTAVIVR